MRLRNLLLISFLLPAIAISGCIASNPEAFAKTIPIVQEFLSKHPNAEIRMVHYSANESAAIIDLIKEDCGKLSVEPKEYYFVNISDPSEGMNVRVWIDWENQVIECAYKEGSSAKPLSECTPRYRAECFGDHVYWFDSCGNREDKKEFCPLGCDEHGCIKSIESCDIGKTYHEKPSCTCPEGYEMIEFFPRCGGNDCMEECEEKCKKETAIPCIDKCMAENACASDDEECYKTTKDKCSGLCNENALMKDCITACSSRCAAQAAPVTGAITGMPYAAANTAPTAPQPVIVKAGSAGEKVEISPSFTTDYNERCPGGAPVYKCVKKEQCKSHAQTKCYAGHVYWFDSCGHVQDKKEFCQEGCENGFCRKVNEKTCEEMGGYCVYPRVTCPEDARVCPDGTTVGRVPPDCEFKPCPSESVPTSSGGGGGGAATATGMPILKTPAPATEEAGSATGAVSGRTAVTSSNPCPEGHYPANYWCPDNGYCCMPKPHEPESGCWDSDNGLDYYSAGYVKYSGEVYKDYCKEGQVVEFYCRDDGTKGIEDYWCPEGCENSACIERKANETSCYDSDGGENYDQKGVAETADGQKLEDHCNSDGTLTENYCTESGEAVATKYTCPAGTTCFDGACIQTGCNSHEYAACFEGDLYWYDSCNNKEDLKEECPNGCENATCIHEANQTNQTYEKLFAMTAATCENSTILVRVKNTGNTTLEPDDFTITVNQQTVTASQTSINPGEEEAILSYSCGQMCPPGNYSIIVQTADTIHDGLAVCE